MKPKSDVCMKELFRNETVLKYFISAVLKIPPEEIRSVRLRNTFLWRRHQKQKQGILDVLAEMNDSTKINIELQVKHYAEWDRRQLFYLAKMYAEELKIGEDYSRLKRCVAISILDFNLTDRKEYHHAYRLRDELGYEFSDVWEVHVLELKKTLAETGELEDWMRFFRSESEEELNMIHTKNPGILEAIREVREMGLSRRLKLRYEAYLKQVRDENAWKKYERAEARKEGLAAGREEGLAAGRQEGLAAGREEGLAAGREEGLAAGREEGLTIGREEGRTEGRMEGRMEGRTEGRTEIIRNMLEKKLSDRDIITFTGCSEEELDEIKKAGSLWKQEACIRDFKDEETGEERENQDYQ